MPPTSSAGCASFTGRTRTATSSHAVDLNETRAPDDDADPAAMEGPGPVQRRHDQGGDRLRSWNSTDRRRRVRASRNAHQSRLQCGGRHAARAAPSRSARVARAIPASSRWPNGNRHDRGSAPPLPRTVLFHQGRARDRTRALDGLRDRSATPRHARNPKCPRPGNNVRNLAAGQ